MLTITEWAKLNPQPLAQGVVEVFVQNNPVLALMPFQNIAGNAYKYNTEETLPGVAFRAVGDSYTESTGVINPTIEPLAILGGDSDYDVSEIAMQVASGSNDVRAVYDALKAKAISLKHLQTFFFGDTSVDANSFDGLAKRLTGNQVIAAGTNGAALTLDMLDELIDQVASGPTALLARKGTIRALRRLIRTAAGGATAESIMVKDYGGPVLSYNGVPIFPVEQDLLGDEVFPANEVAGTNDATCSMFAVRFGPDALHGIQTAPVSVRDLGELEVKPAYRTRIEWYVGSVLKAPRCAARLSGLTDI